jgi:predicted nucleic acid-binding protein
MILCDTNIFIEIFRKNVSIRSELDKIGCENILASDVVKAELFFGAKNKGELQSIKNYLNNFSSLTIQSEISKMAVDFVEKYCLSENLNLPDALIAATAIYYNIELFTLNRKHFVFIPDLKLYQR